MNLNDYQTAALKTANYPDDFKIIYPLMGLAGEAGEVLNKAKKVIRDQNGDFSSQDTKDKLIDELGDVLWYIAVTAHDLGATFEDVGQRNLDKLKSRHERNMIQGSGDNR